MMPGMNQNNMFMPKVQQRMFAVDNDSHDDFSPKSKVSTNTNTAVKEVTEHIS